MEDTLLHAPFSMGIFGSRGSGKTQFAKQLLQSNLISPAVERVLWVYKSWQVEQEELMRDTRFSIDFVDEIPPLPTKRAEESTLIVIDDCMNEVGTSEVVEALFTRGRHLNVSVIVLAQNLFHQAKRMRNIALNMDYVVIFKNVRDESQIRRYAQQTSWGVNFFMDAYKSATSQPYGHLFLDYTPHAVESLRVRGNIFHSPPTYYVPRNL